ncbi:MAG: glycosyltransferase [Trebonia sp.]|jgi:glycosyltransferase involved in cell wall biosynthesis
MRVLMLAPEPVYTPRGTPIAVLNRCRALTALGQEVDLVTYPFGEDVAVDGLRFVRTPRPPGLRRVKIGPSLAKLPLDALLLLTAGRELRRRHYDFIHTVEEAGVAGWLLHAISGVPYVHDVHSDMITVLRDYGFGRRHPVVLLARWLERRVLGSAKVVIVNFPGLVPVVTAQVPDKPVHMINCWPLGYRVDHDISEKLRSDWGTAGPLILYAGSFEPYQGLPMLLEAMAVVRKSLPRARLVLVGGRPDQVAEITRQAAQLGVAGALICTGQRPPDEIPSYLAAADVLVSARRDGINTPYKVYDYIRAGKPIVATRTASHLDVLNDDCAALADSTPEAFATALLGVLSDAERAGRLGRAATERVRDFGIGTFLRQHAAAYRELGVPEASEQALQSLMESVGEAP